MSLGQENTSTLKEVTERLQDFLTNKKSENIVLTGAWGTGKTQAWKRVVYRCLNPRFSKEIVSFQPFKSVESSLKIYSLEDSKLPLRILPSITSKKSGFFKRLEERELELENRWKSFARRRYAYVSASDCATIKDLEDKIFSSIVRSWRAGSPPNHLGSFFRNGTTSLSIGAILALLPLLYCLIWQQNWLKQLADIQGFSIAAVVASLIAGVVAFIQLFFNFWQQSQRRWLLKDAIICIDDIERASKKIDPQEILNLAADLKENKNCKVALILNQDEFYSENEEKIFLISKLEHAGNANNKDLKELISLAEDKTSEFSKKLSKKELWKKALEKGSDSHLELILNTQDAAKLAFTNKDGKETEDKESALVWALRSQVQEHDVQINNVRIISLIWNALERLEGVVKLLSDEDKGLKGESWRELRKKLGVARETFEQSLWHKLAVISVRLAKYFYRIMPEGVKLDDLEAKIIDYLNHFSKRDFNISCDKEEKSLIKLCWENLERGSLLEDEAFEILKSILEKERKALKTRIQQETDKFQREIIEAPIRAAIFQDDSQDKVKDGLVTLEQMFMNNNDFINKIGLSAMNYLLYLAKRVDRKDWIDTFRNPYMQNFKKQRDDFFSSWPDAILLKKDNENGLTAYSMPVDKRLKKAFEEERDDREEKRQKAIKEEHEEVRRNKNYLKEALTQLSYSIFSFDFDQYKDFYEDWTLDALRKTLKEFSLDDRLRIAENYWQGCFSIKIPHEYCGMSNILAQNNILEELKFRNSENNWIDSSQTLEKLRIFRPLGILLYEALDEYRKSDFMMGYDLEQELEKKRWTELDKIKIPTDEEIKEQAKTSPENTN